MARGIDNVSGVSCHISCALQVLYHTFGPLIKVLRESKRQKGVLAELSRFVQTLDDTTSNPPLNPIGTLLYQSLEKETLLDQNDVGDASSAMLKILQVIRNQGSSWSLLLEKCGGETSQVILGRRNDGDTVILRTKRGKRKAMVCPFPLTGDILSVEAALHDAQN
jgi:hypothetical protein